MNGAGQIKLQGKLSIIVALVAGLCATSVAQAESRATKADAEAMVKKGIAHLKQVGAETAYKEMTAPAKNFVDRDLYLVVYDMNGKCLAHGQNPRQVGKDLIDMKDPDGKPFVKERVELAKAKGSFWQDYKFTDPLTKQVLPKQMFCQKVDDVAVCGGIYKD